MINEQSFGTLKGLLKLSFKVFCFKNLITPIGQLMHDFRCVEAEDMHNKVLADEVRYFKETEGGREVMCKVMEYMRNEASIEAIKNERSRLIEKILKKGDSIEAIADFLIFL